MTGSRFPRAYTSDVRVDRSTMEYVEFEKMDIGARPSGLPKGGVAGIRSIEHVGKEARGSAKAVK
jgi:hypothetical protein